LVGSGGVRWWWRINKAIAAIATNFYSQSHGASTNCNSETISLSRLYIFTTLIYTKQLIAIISIPLPSVSSTYIIQIMSILRYQETRYITKDLVMSNLDQPRQYPQDDNPRQLPKDNHSTHNI